MSTLISLDAVIVAVTADTPRVLVIGDPAERPALPSGPLDLGQHLSLERGLRDWVQHQAGLTMGYVEQLYTFGDRFRDPRERAGGPRVISTAYLALVREQSVAPELSAAWADWYRFLPWEDWRHGMPDALQGPIRGALSAWLLHHPEQRERVQQCFGWDGVPFDPERTLERYELLWEAGLVSESPQARADAVLGQPMALDHRRILATALGRLRGKIKYRPVVFELLPERFTLGRLQSVVEALTGHSLHKQNFRRLVAQTGLVEATGAIDTATGGRPAELYRFRREVLRERPAPGVALPRGSGLRHA